MLNHKEFTNKYANALEDIANEIDHRIIKTAESYRRKAREDQWLNAMKSKPKMSKRKMKDMLDSQIANHVLRINPTYIKYLNAAGALKLKSARKKRRSTSQYTYMRYEQPSPSKKKKKKPKGSPLPKLPLELENELFWRVRSSLQIFQQKKRDFLLSVLNLYKEMDALDMTDLKQLIELKFINTNLSFALLNTPTELKQEEEIDEKNDGDKTNTPSDVVNIEPLMSPDDKNDIGSLTSILTKKLDPASSSNLMLTAECSSVCSTSGTRQRQLIEDAFDAIMPKRQSDVVKMKSKFNLSEGSLSTIISSLNASRV